MTWDDHPQPYTNLGWVWEGRGVEAIAKIAEIAKDCQKLKGKPLPPRAAVPHGLSNLSQIGMVWDGMGEGVEMPPKTMARAFSLNAGHCPYTAAAGSRSF